MIETLWAVLTSLIVVLFRNFVVTFGMIEPMGSLFRVSQKAKIEQIDDYGGCTVSGKSLRLGVNGKPMVFGHTAVVDLFYFDTKIQALLSSKKTK